MGIIISFIERIYTYFTSGQESSNSTCLTIPKGSNVRDEEFHDIFIVLVLKELLSRTLGNNYPTDLLISIVRMIPRKIVLSAGADYTIISGSHTYVFGSNSYGQLGMNINYRQMITPHKLVIGDNLRIKAIECGYYHTVVLVSDGTLYVWGMINAENKPNVCDIPQQLKIKNTRITAATCGYSHAIVLTSNGEIYGWGDNSSRQLGLGCNSKEICTPTKIALSSKVVLISCGAYHTFALVANSELCGWGNNMNGQLGLDYGVMFKPTKVHFSSAMAISCGDYHTMILTVENELFACGWNSMDQLGIDSEKRKMNRLTRVPLNEKFISVKCGAGHTMALTIKGELYSWGCNKYGQLGSYDDPNAIKTYRLPQKINLPLVKSIVCGNNHTVAVGKNNEIWIWGYNACSQLGLGDTKNRFEPEQLILDV